MADLFADSVRIIDFIVLFVGLISSLFLMQQNRYPRLAADAAALPVVWQLIRIATGNGFGSASLPIVIGSVLILIGLVLLNLDILPGLVVLPFALMAAMWLYMMFGAFSDQTSIWLITCVFYTLHFAAGTAVTLSSASYMNDLRK